MALWKYFKQSNIEPKEGIAKCLLTPKEVIKADAAVALVLESATEVKSRGKYNSFTDRQRTEIGKYTVENSATKAAAHFCSF